MIRNAQKKDAKAAIELLILAMEDIAFSLSGADNFRESAEILCEFFVQKNNRLSYENILVFEIENCVVGAICAFNGLKSRELDLPFIRRLESLGKHPNIATECDKNAFYISDLAVNENFRGQKIATKLVEAVCAKAKNLGFQRVCLIVDTLKPKVRKFYENLGFKMVENSEIFRHKYDFMVKEIG